MKNVQQRLARFALCAVAVLSTQTVLAQVALPNGTPDVPVVDLRVKVLGGQVTIDRQWWEGQWRINLRWAPAEWAGSPSGSGGCLAYPEVKVQGRTYLGDGQAWLLENRYSVRAIDHFAGSECLANRTKKLKWQDRITGNWMEYERVDAGTLQFRLARYGDRNDVTVNLAYDAGGQLTEVRDHFHTPVLQYLYTGGQLAEIRDVPTTADPSPARSVKYTWGQTTVNGQAVPVITQVTDVLGNLTRYGINAGKLETITDPESRVRTYAYIADRVLSYTDGEGQVTSYVYDYDKLKKEFYVRITSPAGTQTEQWYDSEGRLIRWDEAGQTTYRRTAVDTVARTETRADAAGRQTTTTRDEYGNLTKTVYPDGSSTSAVYSAVHGQVTEETDELGIKTRYDYDAKGNLVKKTEAVGRPEERVTDYQVDAYGQVLQETRKGGSISLPNNQTYAEPDATRRFEYDAHGNRVAVTDALGNATRITVNRQGQLLARTDAHGKVWTQTIDAAGQLLTRQSPLGGTIHYAYDKVGNRIKTTDPIGNTWQSSFDKNGREIALKNPLAETWARQYDAQGRLVSETDAVGNFIYTLVYDIQDRPVESIDAAGNRTKVTWDDTVEPDSPVKLETLGITRTYTYDARGRVKETRDTASTLVGGTSQIVTAVTRKAWDAKGQMVETSDKNGHNTQIVYDGLGRMTQVTDALGGATRYIWDRADNLLAVTDAQGSTTRYTYDAENRRTSEIWPLGQTSRYDYDALGRLTKVTDPKGNQVAYQYDDAGRRTGEIHTPAGASTPSRSISYTWNAVGQLTGYSDSNSSHADHLAHAASYTLDALGRKTLETLTYGSQTYTQGTTWGADGHKASQTWSDGQVLTYAWLAGQLQRITYPEHTATTIAERWWNLPTTMLYPGGTTETHNWDGFGRLIGQQVKSPGQAILLQRSLSYDPENNPTRIDTELGRHEYNYDAINRVVAAIHPSGLPTEGFTLDGVGNRLADRTKPNPAQANGQWRYNANHQLLQAATENTAFFGNNSQPIDHTWDDSGNLIQKATPVGTEGQLPTSNQRYRYDAQNRLIETQTPQGEPIASYQYDPYGRRIRKTIYREWISGWQALAEPRIYTYLYSDEGLTAEYRQTGGQIPELIATHGWEPESSWGTAALWTKAQRGDTGQVERLHHHNDHLGTPQKSTDASGGVVWSTKATAFGETTADPGSVIENPFRFPGQYYDWETNTHYNYFRNYDSSIGRYTRGDPIGLDGGLNVYLYANANPLSYTDPYGLCPPDGWAYCQRRCAAKGQVVKDCKQITIPTLVDLWGCDCEKGCRYENPGHHDPNGGPNKYNPTKETLPKNHEELWKQSRPDPDNPDKTRWAKEGEGKNAVYHRFQNDGNGNWHWNGSTNGTTASGEPRSIPPNKVPKF